MNVKRIEIAKISLFCALSLVSHQLVLAQTSVKKVDSKKAEIKESAKFSGSATTYINSGLQKFDSVQSSQSADFALALRLATENISFGLNSSMSKGLTGERDFTFNNVALSAAKSLWKSEKDLSVSGKLSLTLPFSERSKDYQKLITGVATSVPVVYKATDSITLAYIPTVGVNFHRAEVALNGSSNYQYTVTNTLNADFALSDRFTFSALGQYSRLITYRGNTRDAYKFEQSLSYDFSPYTVAIGHSMGGTPLAANGIETEVKLFDSNQSTVYGQFGISF
ncbi:MAG: hypothetical protein ACN6I6_02360 [bacterium]